MFLFKYLALNENSMLVLCLSQKWLGLRTRWLFPHHKSASPCETCLFRIFRGSEMWHTWWQGRGTEVQRTLESSRGHLWPHTHTMSKMVTENSKLAGIFSKWEREKWGEKRKREKGKTKRKRDKSKKKREKGNETKEKKEKAFLWEQNLPRWKLKKKKKINKRGKKIGLLGIFHGNMNGMWRFIFQP